MKKFLKVVLWTVAIILGLVVATAVFFQTPPGKKIVRNITVNYLESKFGTKVVVKKIDYKIPSMVGLEGVMFLDKNADTLLSLNKLQVNIALLELLNNKLRISALNVEGLYANMHRKRADTTFNYQFIIDAFASTQTNTTAETEDTSATSLLFDVNKVRFKDITFIFNDEAGGTYFDIILDSLLLRPKKIDPATMIYTVEELIIYKADAVFRSFPGVLPPDPDTSTSPTPLVLQADKLLLLKSGYTMHTEPDSFYLDVSVGRLDGRLDLFDLAKSLVDIDELTLEDAQTVIAMGKGSSVEEPEPVSAEDTAGSEWRIAGNKLSLKNVAFKMDNNAAPKLQEGVDYAHMHLTNVSLIADSLLFTTSDTITAQLRHLALREKSGLHLIEFRTDFVYHQKGVLMENFYLMTPGTLLKDRIELSYPSLNALSKDMGAMYTNINLADSKIAMDDVLLFVPAGSKAPLTAYKGQQINISGNASGYLSSLYLKNIRINGLKNTMLALNGNIQGLPEPAKLAYDLDIEQANTTYADIQSFIPQSVSEQVRVPKDISVRGKLKGTLYTYEPDLAIVTSDGNARIKGLVSMAGKAGNEKFDLAFQTDQLNIGKIIKQDSLLGMVTMSGQATGTGFDIKTMNAAISGNVKRFDFKGYAYTDVLLDANIARQLADINLQSRDPNADMELVAQVDLSKEYPSVNAAADLRHIDIGALGFFADTLTLGGKLQLNFSDLNPDRPAGFLTWSNPLINYKGDTLIVDSLYVISSPDEDSGQYISTYIPGLLNAQLTGHIPLTKIGDAMLYHINEYFTINDSLKSMPGNYDMELALGINYHPSFASFIPDLKPFDTIGLAATITPTSMLVNLSSPALTYGKHHIRNLSFHMDDSSANALNYSLTLDQYYQEGGIQVYTPTLFGYLKDDSLYTTLKTFNESGVENYSASALATTYDNVYYASLLPPLKLNYDLWDVRSNNIFAYGDSGFYVNNLGISKNNESISIESQTPSAFGSPVNILLNDFELANLSKIYNPDSLIAEGKLNANTTIDFSDSFPLITGKVNVRDLAVYETPLGRLDADINNTNANTYNVDARITENENSIALTGSYYLEPVDGDNFNFDLKLDALSLKSFEGLSFGNLKDSKGFLRGGLKINGTTEAPRIVGELNTDQLETRIVMINSRFKMPSERIRFDNGIITFDNFSIYDTLGKSAVITGNAQTRNYTDYDMDLHFNADNWMMMNSTRDHYELMYGKVFLSSNIDIKGTATAPIIDGNLVLHDSTRFYYANIDEGPGLNDYEGIVLFTEDVNKYNPEEDSLSKIAKKVQNAMTMNLNVETKEHATFNVIVDPMTGDNLSVNGSAFINASMMPGGSLGLAGVYHIDGGYYELHYELLKRKFTIEEGSVIQLAGDPMEANVNIVAAYRNELSPYDLVSRVVDDADLVFYKQRLPFKVLLKITGKPLNPVIAFDIELEEAGKQDVSKDVADKVEERLRTMRNDVAEMNKQVFAVLLFNRFVADDPFQSGNATSMEYFARQSASRFLSQQLNSLAGRLINGLDLSIDIESAEDYSTGQKQNRTSVNLQAQKKLFNDRLTVAVGNDFQIEGAAIPGRESSIIPGNISLDYKLVPDGRYGLRAYRKNQLQNVIDGFVVETGLGLRLNYDYNRFRQLFRNRRKARERRERNRQLQEEQNKGDSLKVSDNSRI